MRSMAGPDLLMAIVDATKRTVELRRERDPEAIIERRAARMEPRGATFEAELCVKHRVNIIAECKRRSPSHGVLVPDYDPTVLAKAYVRAGAVAISVLTEPTFFDGALAHLKAVRSSVAAPLLRKDFIVDKYQLIEARAAGADAVLLIVSALTQSELLNLSKKAGEIGLAVLVEVHDEEELSRAVDAGARIIGVNNRNLRTLVVDVDTSLRLAVKLPSEVIGVSESGLSALDDIKKLSRAGYRGFLIGERLITNPDPAATLATLTGVRISS